MVMNLQKAHKIKFLIGVGRVCSTAIKVLYFNKVESVYFVSKIFYYKTIRRLIVLIYVSITSKTAKVHSKD